MAKGDTERIILKMLAGAGFLSIALVAPNALQALRPFLNKKYDSQNKYYFNKVLNRLIEKKLVIIKTGDNNQKIVQLTKKGEGVLDRSLCKELPRQKVWDGKFRVLIFDIKEKRRGTRDKLREQLRNWGFLKLQDSVWVYPYPCEDVIALLKADMFIGKDVLYMTVNSIENDAWIRKSFNLA